MPAEPTNRSPSWGFSRRNELGLSPGPLGTVALLVQRSASCCMGGGQHAIFTYVRYLAYCVSKPSGLDFVSEKSVIPDCNNFNPLY